MQEKFKKIIDEFNTLIANIAEPQFKQLWQVNVADGSVAFGSARDNWALTVPFMIKRISSINNSNRQKFNFDCQKIC